MTFWNRIEQHIKRNHMRWLQLMFGKKTIQPNLVNFTEIHRILVIRQHDMLGDFLLSTPVLRALREHFPQAHIGVVVRRYFADVAEMNPYVDEVLVFEEDGKNWTFAGLRAFWKQLRSGWDLAVVLNTVSHSLTSDLISAFSKAKWVLGSSHRVFPGTDRNFFYNLLAPYWEGERHQTHRNLDIVRHIGVDTKDPSEVLEVDENILERAQEILENLGLREESYLIGMHVGAGKMFNRWPIIRFAELAQRLHDEFDAQIVLFWGPKEQDLADQFQNYVQFQPMLVEPTSLKELVAFFSLCDAMVCNDTGVMHLAAAAGVPLVAIFGPTDPNEWKPLGDEFIAIRGKRDKTDAVRVQQVMAALGKLLDEDVASAREDESEEDDEPDPASVAEAEPAETAETQPVDEPGPVKLSDPPPPDRIEVLQHIESNMDLNFSFFRQPPADEHRSREQQATPEHAMKAATPAVSEKGDEPAKQSAGQETPESESLAAEPRDTEEPDPVVVVTEEEQAGAGQDGETGRQDAANIPDKQPAEQDDPLLSTAEIEKIELELNQLADLEKELAAQLAKKETRPDTPEPEAGETEPSEAAASTEEPTAEAYDELVAVEESAPRDEGETTDLDGSTEAETVPQDEPEEVDLEEERAEVEEPAEQDDSAEAPEPAETSPDAEHESGAAAEPEPESESEQPSIDIEKIEQELSLLTAQDEITGGEQTAAPELEPEESIDVRQQPEDESVPEPDAQHEEAEHASVVSEPEEDGFEEIEKADAPVAAEDELSAADEAQAIPEEQNRDTEEDWPEQTAEDMSPDVSEDEPAEKETDADEAEAEFVSPDGQNGIVAVDVEGDEAESVVAENDERAEEESPQVADTESEQEAEPLSPFDISDDVLSKYMDELQKLESLTEEQKKQKKEQT